MRPKSAKKNALTQSNGESVAILVDPPYLYLGPQSSSSPSFISAKGVTDILSIGASPLSIIPNVTYNRISLLDDAYSPIEANAIITTVAENPPRKIFVHCSVGVAFTNDCSWIPYDEEEQR